MVAADVSNLEDSNKIGYNQTASNLFLTSNVFPGNRCQKNASRILVPGNQDADISFQGTDVRRMNLGIFSQAPSSSLNESEWHLGSKLNGYYA